jgi:hypothetical protein
VIDDLINDGWLSVVEDKIESEDHAVEGYVTVASAIPVNNRDHLRRIVSGDEHIAEVVVEVNQVGADDDVVGRTPNWGVGEYAEPEVGPSGDCLRVATYYGAGLSQDDNFAVRKVLYFEDALTTEVNQMIRHAIDRGSELSAVVLETHPEIIERIRRVAAIVTTGVNDPHGAATDLGDVLPLRDTEALGHELEGSPIGKDVAEKEDEEAVETAAAALPSDALLGMTQSKGLSAHHVIVLGCDNVNMVKISELTFFVALTRARKTLHLVASMRAGGDDAHRFLYDLPAESCSYFAYLKGTRKRTALSGKQAFQQKLSSWRGKRPPPKKRSRRTPEERD